MQNASGFYFIREMVLLLDFISKYSKTVWQMLEIFAQIAYSKEAVPVCKISIIVRSHIGGNYSYRT